jgi:hypothetical protein
MTMPPHNAAGQPDHTPGGMSGVPSDGRDHVVSDVSLIADPVAGINRQKDPGFTQAMRLIHAG